MNLTTEQEILLNDLLQRREWVQLLEALKDGFQVRPWKPSRTEDDDEQRKTAQWVFESGVQRGFHDIVTILGRGKI